jgi:hypothetical protein
MPREVYLLSDAARLGQVLTARCGACGRQRHFNAEDWMRILGDVPVYRVATELKCSSCDTNDHLRVRVAVPTASERQAMKMTRVKAIRYVRRIEWEDER